MWFKNLQIYRLTAPWTLSPEQLHDKLIPHAFQPCSSIELQSQGWIPPRENGVLVHAVNHQMLILLGTEKKLLPASVINQVTKARAVELEEQQGFKPGRKQMRDLKEQVADELLPRAFSVWRNTWTWIDPVNGWLVVDAASPAKADEVFKLLLKSIDRLPVESLRTQRTAQNGWLVVDAASPAKADEVFKLLLKSIDRLPVESLRTQRTAQSCMTEWLASNEAPGGFTVDQDTELRAAGESKATVRYVRHTVEADEVQRHIAAGKQCTRLAMTWADRVSFVLTDTLAVKRVAALDVLKEDNDVSTMNEEERFDSDFALMSGELAKMMEDLVEALGGVMAAG